MAKEFEDKFYQEIRSDEALSTRSQSSLDEMTVEQKIKILSEMPVEEIKQAISGMSLEEQKTVLTSCIAFLDSNVIKDPRTLETLQKELSNVQKEMKKKESQKAVENGDLVGEETVGKDVDEDFGGKEDGQTELKDEVVPEENEQQVENAKQAYYNAMIALHDQKMKTIVKQKTAVPTEFISSDVDFELEMKLETELYVARNAYMKLGKEDPYTEKRTELTRLEKEAKEPIEMELRNRAKRFREIEQKIKELDERERELNEELLKEHITDHQISAINHELEEMGETRKKLELERADIKERLDVTIEVRRQRAEKRRLLEKERIKTLTDEDVKNDRYQKSKVNKMNRNFDEATKQHYNNIERRIEERENKIDALNQELDSLKKNSPTDFERRLFLLNELDKETHMLEADEQAKDDLDKGILPDRHELRQEAYEKAANEEYRQEEFDKATVEVREAIDMQKAQIGQAVVANPTLANEEQRDRVNTIKAATIAKVYDSPAPGKDDIIQDAKQYVVAKSVIEGLEEKVRDPENPEDAQAMVEHDEQLRAANAEIEKVQDSIEDKLGE